MFTIYLFSIFKFNSSGIVPRFIRLIKKNFPTAVVITDIALDPYSSEVSIHIIFTVFHFQFNCFLSRDNIMYLKITSSIFKITFF